MNEPPGTSTLPLWSSVALGYTRGALMLATSVHVFVPGS
jgi:hypothetical protein